MLETDPGNVQGLVLGVVSKPQPDFDEVSNILGKIDLHRKQTDIHQWVVLPPSWR